MAKLYLGTSGFKFQDWKGNFYTPQVKEKDWLAYYAERFNALEVNSSYYRLLPPATLFHMANKVPPDFLFTVKAYRTLTHEISAENAADFAAFKDSLRPLSDAGKFGCILAQFPSSFHHTPESRQYLAHLREQLADYPLAIEFRHREWVQEEVFAFLRQHRIGWCGVDQPQFPSLLPPIAPATSEIGYVRFHGRNYQGWWGGKARRYDYLYSDEELQEWVPRIQRLEQETEKVFVFLNNCYEAKATQNALRLRELLELAE